MTTYARVIDNTAIEVFTPPDGFTIDDCFHPDVAALFEVVPDSVTPNSVRNGGVWTIHMPADAAPPKPGDPTFTDYPEVSPVEFKLLFTSMERIAIKAARSNDPVIDDFMSIVEDPRLKALDLKLDSNKQAIEYTLGVIGQKLNPPYQQADITNRATQILHGIMP